LVHGWGGVSGRCRIGLERGRESRAAQVENGEESAHDGGGPGDDDAGDDAHLAVRIALADGVRAAPDFDDAPKESEHEEDSEGRAETLLEGRGAGRLREDRREADGGFARKGNQ
jgi:hypothetical protein